jgi:hypothetical protein
MKQVASTTSYWFCVFLSLRPRIWRQNGPPKRQLTFNGLHGVIFQILYDYEYWVKTTKYGIFL